MGEAIAYVGVAGMVIGLGIVFGAIFYSEHSLKKKGSYDGDKLERTLRIGFFVFIISGFVTIGAALGSSDLGQMLLN